MEPSRTYLELSLQEVQDLAPQKALVRRPPFGREEDETRPRPARANRVLHKKEKNEEAGLYQIIGQATQAMATHASVCKREHLNTNDADTIFALDIRNKLKHLEELSFIYAK